MTHALVRFGDEGREGVMRGVEIMADSAKAPLSFVQSPSTEMYLGNDSATIAAGRVQTLSGVARSFSAK